MHLSCLCQSDTSGLVLIEPSGEWGPLFIVTGCKESSAPEVLQGGLVAERRCPVCTDQGRSLACQPEYHTACAQKKLRLVLLLRTVAVACNLARHI